MMSVQNNVACRFCSFIGLLAVFLPGCGESGPVADIEVTVPASGVLKHQGKPLEYHQIMLYPEGKERPAAGTSDEQGRFTLGTNSQTDGAVSGRHRVSIVYVGPPAGPDAGMNDFSPPPPPKVKISDKHARAETSEVVVDIPDAGVSDLVIDLK